MNNKLIIEGFSPQQEAQLKAKLVTELQTRNEIAYSKYSHVIALACKAWGWKGEVASTFKAMMNPASPTYTEKAATQFWKGIKLSTGKNGYDEDQSC